MGHPPFGHAGERRLDQLLRPHGGQFDHNLHALRIVEQFEQRYIDFPGLNLTFELREGIVKHSRDYTVGEHPELAEYELELRPPLEAQLMDAVDEIAYNVADLDDGFESKLLDLAMLREELPMFAETYADVEGEYPQAREQLKFNEAIKRILDRLATDLIEQTRTRVLRSGVQTVDEVRRAPERLAGFGPDSADITRVLKSFLYRRLYNNEAIVEEREPSVDALEHLFRHYMNHPNAMPHHFAKQTEHEPLHRVVCDYIAGMTDGYLLRQYHALSGVPTRGT
jgi:dGTPase